MTAPTTIVMGAPPFGAECGNCGREFRNRETMTAIPFKSGEPSDWYCSACVACWRRGDNIAWRKRQSLADDSAPTQTGAPT